MAFKRASFSPQPYTPVNSDDSLESHFKIQSLPLTSNQQQTPTAKQPRLKKISSTGSLLSLHSSASISSIDSYIRVNNTRNLKEYAAESSHNEVNKMIHLGEALGLDVVVAADGSGKYRTVSAAVADAPKHSAKRYIIKIKAGVYRENVEVPSEKTNIMFLGDGRKKTIITSSRNVVDGGTTYHSATVAFYKCGMVAYQNTLHVHSNRQFFTNCYIAGTVDFIFGNSAAVFQDCDIRARRPNPGQTITITAQGRSDPNQKTGIVIQKSRIGATPDLQHARSNFSAYLGRPWKEYSRTVIMQSSISDVISPAGWREWKGRFALNTLHFAEYENSGAGAGTAGRVPWKGYKVITDATEAQAFTARNFITGSSWLKSTTFPFSLGL
ncbi:hypothetical protein D5086_005937 [Populus alba]|uniref:Uncharacterized protein n=1 Tax=Populus alba TaxID=43335 RepID=A0ACC4CIZ6_POPAL